MKLIFSLIKNGMIFEPEFESLSTDNGTIEFKHLHMPGGIAVVYAPNGTGKSSLTRVLRAEEASEKLCFKAVDDTGMEIKPESKKFHIIPDQINRNIIRGKETDYLIGRQIKREYELRDKINSTFDVIYAELSKKYKTDFKVNRVTDFLLTQITVSSDDLHTNAYNYIRSIVNNKDHGKNIDQKDFIDFIRDGRNNIALVELDAEKKKWVIATSSEKQNIVNRIIGIEYRNIVPNIETIQIERHDDAIGILKKYKSLSKCIVCNNRDFDGETLLVQKTNDRKRIYEELDSRTKDLLDNVVKDKALTSSDPFDIKRIIRDFIAGGDATELCDLQKDLTQYVRVIGDEMINALMHCVDGSSLLQDFDEYSALVTTQPQLDTEELLFIEDIINESIGKDITIERDADTKNYKLKLGEKDLLNTDRAAMELSSGEQNFISLAFELLLARHSDREYVILDDPISSFDSVYKNKIAYCVVKFLEEKKQIVLTHNTDLIRLLDVQLNNCFNLYILNNVENGKNGFIPVTDKEKKLLINLHELVKLFQNKGNSLVPAIKNRRQFLMAMIPFMRGYAHISLDDDDDFGTLSNIMHGYGTGSVDVTPIYKRLFGYDFGDGETITVDDVLNVDCDSIDILDETMYPLLSETLKQTLIYYYLRMKVEKVLVDSFAINVNGPKMLNQIIRSAFNCNSSDPNYEKKRNYRVFFTSRKTLLNEFNHFEGNMNIFQPAIDISLTALNREISSIETKLVEVKVFASGTTI